MSSNLRVVRPDEQTTRDPYRELYSTSSLHGIIDVCERGMDRMKFCMEGQINSVERASEGESKRRVDESGGGKSYCDSEYATSEKNKLTNACCNYFSSHEVSPVCQSSRALHPEFTILSTP